jgi:hypothetical protein
MRFNESKYESATRAYHVKWHGTDEVLYDLCRQYPDHSDRNGVDAKLLIIGRAYGTGIERKIHTDKTQGSSTEQLADHFWDHRKKADSILDRVRGIKGPLSRGKLSMILREHGQLLDLVKETVRPGQTPRSFASKYLHFHFPEVPIFDSFIEVELNKLYRRERDPERSSIPEGADKIYSCFSLRFWRLYEEARQSRPEVSVKLLDNYLLELSRKEQSLRPRVSRCRMACCLICRIGTRSSDSESHRSCRQRKRAECRRAPKSDRRPLWRCLRSIRGTVQILVRLACRFLDPRPPDDLRDSVRPRTPPVGGLRGCPFA